MMVNEYELYIVIQFHMRLAPRLTPPASEVDPSPEASRMILRQLV